MPASRNSSFTEFTKTSSSLIWTLLLLVGGALGHQRLIMGNMMSVSSLALGFWSLVTVGLSLTAYQFLKWSTDEKPPLPALLFAALPPAAIVLFLLPIPPWFTLVVLGSGVLVITGSFLIPEPKPVKTEQVLADDLATAPCISEKPFAKAELSQIAPEAEPSLNINSLRTFPEAKAATITEAEPELLKIFEQTPVEQVPAEQNETETENDANLTSLMRRYQEQDGTDIIEGHQAIQFARGKKSGVIHLPFVPAFATAPEIICESPALQIRVRTVKTFGARIEVRRRDNLHCEETHLVQFSVVSISSLHDAA